MTHVASDRWRIDDVLTRSCRVESLRLRRSSVVIAGAALVLTAATSWAGPEPDPHRSDAAGSGAPRAAESRAAAPNAPDRASDEPSDAWSAWLDAAAFSVRGADLLAAPVAGRPEGLDVEILVHDLGRALDADGRVVTTEHRIVRVLSRDGVVLASAVDATYDPAFQDLPELRARIISAGGQEVALDPATATTLSVQARGVTKRRVAPLPRVAIGSIVETWTRTVGRAEPLEVPAYVWSHEHEPASYTRVRRIGMSVPVNRPLARHARGEGIELREHVSEGVRSVWVTQRGLRPLAPRTEWTDWESSPVPDFVISAAGSWQRVAAMYADAVDAALVDFDTSPIARELREAIDGAELDATALSKLVVRLHKRTAGQRCGLGDTRPVRPSAPDARLSRPGADCFDAAIALVGALRARGVEAHVALVRADLEVDVPDALVGLHAFRVPLVRVELASGPTWVAISSRYAPAGVLPYGIEGRLALVADPGTEKLVRLPGATPESSPVVEEITVEADATESASVVYRVQASGARGVDLRAQWSRPRSDLLRLVLGNREIPPDVELRTSNLLALEQPIELEVRFRSTQPHATTAIYGLIRRRGYLHAAIPYVRRNLGLEDDAPDPRFESVPTRRPYGTPQRVEQTLVWSLPPGYKFDLEPRRVTRELRGATGASTFEIEPNGALRAVTSLQVFRPRVTPEEAQELRDAAEALAVFGGFSRIRAVVVSKWLLDHGEGRAALAAARARVEAEPKSVDAELAYLYVLEKLGIGRGAVQVAERVARRYPDSIGAQLALAQLALRDELGRVAYPQHGIAAAERAVRRALELDPTSHNARDLLVELLLRDTNGRFYASRARIVEAIELARSREPDGLRTRIGVLEALVARGRAEEAGALIDPRGGSPSGWSREVVEYTHARELIEIVSQGADAAFAEWARTGREPALDVLWPSLARVGRFDLAHAVARHVGLRREDWGPSRPASRSVAAPRELRALAHLAQRRDCSKQSASEASWIEGQLASLRTGEQTPEALVTEQARAAGDSLVDLRSLRDWMQPTSVADPEQRVHSGLFPPDCVASIELDPTRRAARVRVTHVDLIDTLPGRSDARTDTLYLASTGDSPRIVRVADARPPRTLGGMALRALREDRIAEARVWLRWARDELYTASPKRRGGRAEAGLVDPGQPIAFAETSLARGIGLEPELRELSRALIPGDLDALDPRALEVAASVLALDAPATLDVIERAANDLESTDPERADALRLVAASGALRLAPSRAERFLPAGASFGRHERVARLLRIEALSRLGDHDRATTEVRRYRSDYPEDRRGSGAAGRLALRVDVSAGATAAGGNPDLRRDAARAALFARGIGDVVSDDAWRRARKGAVDSVDPSRTARGEPLVAAMWAESGSPERARKALDAALARGGWGADEEDLAWYAIGRMLEELDLREDAARAYRRVLPDDDPAAPWPLFALARSRLERLGSDAAAAVGDASR